MNSTTTTSTTQRLPLGRWHRLFYRGPSTEELYNDFACERRIDDTAPISASFQVTIDASVDRVWEVLSRPNDWGGVDPTIRDVRLDGPVVEGAPFTWRNGRTRMTSRFAVVDGLHELTWTGTALGAKVVHRHVMTPTGQGTTRLCSEESMAGPLLVLVFSSAKLHAALEQWLTAIRTAAES
jgi:Polyketide cyclase / dehydrase and lipid transport